MILRIFKVCLVTSILGYISSINAAEVGHQVPHCQLTSLATSQHFDFRPLVGKVLYVDFWASWCPPCAKSFSFLNTLNHELKNRGLEVAVVNLDEQVDDAKIFLTEHPTNFTVLVDATKQCAKDFDVKAMPSSYLIDRKGIIRHVHLGFKDEDAQLLRNQIEALLAENEANN